MELFRLFGSIMIDDKDAIEKLKSTDKTAKTTAEKFGGLATGAAKVATGIIAVGTAAVAGMSKLVTETSAAGDRVDKMSQKIGLSREGFQEWDFVMSQSGMSIDSLQGGMKTLVNSLDDAKNGGATATQAFGRLGLSMADLEGKSQEEIFEMTVAGLQGVTDETERAALANDLFGRSGSEMTPLLNTSAESIEAMKQQAHDLGMVMSDDAVDGAVQMTDTLDALKRAGAGLMRELGSSLMPVLQTVLDVVIDNMPMIQGLFATLAPILADVFEQLLPPLMDLVVALLPPILEIITMLMPILGELFSTVMPVIIELLGALLPPLIEIIQKLLPVLMPLIEAIMPILSPILELLSPLIDLLMLFLDPLLDLIDFILPPLIELISSGLTTVITGLTEPIGKAAELLTGTFSEAFGAIGEKIGEFKEGLTAVWDWLSTTFSEGWSTVWSGISETFASVVEGLTGIFKPPINGVIDLLNGLIGAINKIQIDVPDAVAKIIGVSSFGFDIPTIPKLAVGMDYVPYDNFPALLHKGERVLTAKENKVGRGGITINMNGPVHVRSDDDVRKIAEEMYRLTKRESMAYGV